MDMEKMKNTWVTIFRNAAYMRDIELFVFCWNVLQRNYMKDLRLKLTPFIFVE